MAREPKVFIEIETEWYSLLEASGFEDIEDTSKEDAPLKEWHSHKFLSEQALIRQQERERYTERMKDVINDPEFPVICYLIASHGNSRVSPIDVRTIAEMHVLEGASNRKIAAKVGRSTWPINRTIMQLREWMKIA